MARPVTKGHDAQVTFKLPHELKREFRLACRSDDIEMTFVLIQMIRYWLADRKKK